MHAENSPSPATREPPETPPDQGCKNPSPGWYCSRKPGHEGPCAARPIPHSAEEIEQAIDDFEDVAIEKFGVEGMSEKFTKDTPDRYARARSKLQKLGQDWVSRVTAADAPDMYDAASPPSGAPETTDCKYCDTPLGEPHLTGCPANKPGPAPRELPEPASPTAETQEIDRSLDNLLFAWLYAHQDAMAGKIHAEDVTAPYQAIQKYVAGVRSENERLREASTASGAAEWLIENNRLRSSGLSPEEAAQLYAVINHRIPPEKDFDKQLALFRSAEAKILAASKRPE